MSFLGIQVVDLDVRHVVLSRRVVSERYQIPLRTLCDWKGNKFLHAEAGGQSVEKKNTLLDDTQLVLLIHETIHQSNRRFNCLSVDVSLKTVKTIKP